MHGAGWQKAVKKKMLIFHLMVQVFDIVNISMTR